MTLVLATEDRSIVDTAIGMEMPLLDNENSVERVVGNAMLEADQHGIRIPSTSDSTLRDVCAMLLDAFEMYGAEDLFDYWRSNFIIHGLV